MTEPVPVGRYLLSRAEGPVLAHLFGSLFPPHGRRERWLRRPAARSRWIARAAYGGEAREETLAQAAGALRSLQAAPPPGAEAAAGEGDWILAGPRPDDPRGRFTAFLFGAPSSGSSRSSGATPDRVVKLRREGAAGPALAAEASVLDRLHRDLPGPLRETVPAVLGRGRLDGEGGESWEVLVLKALPGRSAYVDLQGAILRGRLPGRHLPPAAAWLARFHRTTLLPGEPWRPPPWEALAPPGEGSPPDWYRRLASELDESPCPRAAAHGDFWARNVLLAPGCTGRGSGDRPEAAASLAGVVDWEHFRPSAPPFEDLFHFAWSYGRSFPWAGRRRAPTEAFARTFLRETAVSREVRRYLARYARESGLDAGVLGGLFRVYLLTREDDRKPWTRLYRMLETADASVFSG